MYYNDQQETTLDLTQMINFCQGDIGKKCPKCSGEGVDHNEDVCYKCDGYGVVLREEE